MFNGMHKEAKPHYDNFNTHWESNIDLHCRASKSDLFPSDSDQKLQSDTDAYYYNILALHDMLNQPIPMQSQPSVPDASLLSHQKSRLPKIKLIEFNGDFTLWPLFRDTFTSMVHMDHDVPKIEKFHHLISSLRGPPLTLIKDIPVQEAQYDHAWKTITDTYNNKRLLANHYLNKLMEFKPLCGKPSVAALRLFLSSISESVAAYRLLNIRESEDFIFFFLSIRCLDSNSRVNFERKYINNEFPTFKNLIDFVKEECRTLELLAINSDTPINPQKSHSTSYKGKIGPSSFFINKYNTNQQNANISSPNCPVCSFNHSLYKCDKFRKSSPHERFGYLKKWNGCKNCLANSHSTQKCKSVHNCSHCQKRHHTWLHLEQSDEQNLTSKSENISKPSTSHGSSPSHSVALLGGTSQPVDVLLGTALIRILDHQGHPRTIRAVVDGGSEFSFITNNCKERLGLKQKAFDKSISGIGQSYLCHTKGLVDCQILSSSSNFFTHAVVVPDITGYLPHCTLPQSFTDLIKGYVLADPTFHRPGQIEFLLGADLFYDILSGSPITISTEMPKLIPTAFGHIVAGKYQHKSMKGNVFFVKQSHNLPEIISKFWSVEEVSDHPIVSDEDKFCEEHYQSTHYRTPSGRYVVALPFKEISPPELHTSKFVATKRFFNLESKFAKNPGFNSVYGDFMNDYLSMNHMDRAVCPGKFVIPHHGVWKSEDHKTKLRVVFDGSCKTKNGSLNDHLHSGPKLQQDVSDIVLRFRQHLIVFTTDIIKMYRQILVRPEDCRYQHILWRSHPDEPLNEFQLKTVTYGLSCSPFLALRTIQQLVEDEGAQFPQAAEILKHDIFVDDIVSGSSNIEDALSLQKQLSCMLKRGGFALSKWSSNCPQMLDNVDSLTTRPMHFDSEGDILIKILGLQWDPSEDNFRYKIVPPTLTYTKRGILSAVARIYDPLGYLSPIVLYAKILLQACWQAAIEWDDPVPSDIAIKWRTFVEDLPNLNQIKFPRYIPVANAETIQLVGFCDGSMKGYSATIYLRLETSDNVQVFLLKAKTRLAPLRSVTIPRIELLSALLLCRLYESLTNFLSTIQVHSCYWFTDSTLVLGWLKTPPHRLKTFVCHRVVEITNKTNLNQWYHVSSPENPSDCSSRGILPSELLGNKLWKTGPRWIMQHPSLWPKCSANNIQTGELPETKGYDPVVLSVSHGTLFTNWICHYSSYGKILRIMVYILRALNKMTGWPNRPSKGRRTFKKSLKPSLNCVSTPTPYPILATEYHNANMTFIKIVQQFHIFGNKFNNSALTELRHIRRLNCFIDPLGIVRVGGRLQESSLPYYSKHPIVLPGKCHFSKLLIDHMHRIHLHIGPSALQTIIQQQYWIFSLRTIIKQRIHRCAVCFKDLRHNYMPKMGNLPPHRVVEGDVFKNVGVDYAGPFSIRFSNYRKATCSKAWLCLFVCMATKALHLELVSDCTTEAFLASLDRFIGRRGLPHTIYSDCGSNFQGASHQLKEFNAWLGKTDVQNQIQGHLSPLNIQWSFNPPQAPHFGGLWEAGVKSVKGILKKVMSNNSMTFEELSTIFIRIEAILNSRPLSPLSNDPDDLGYLTPGHFLIGRPLVARSEPDLSQLPLNRLKNWQLVKSQTQHFWQRWRHEYLHRLQHRNKWDRQVPNITVGTMVILRDSRVPPMSWPLGRIIEVFPGKDQVVRVVKVKTSSGIYLRPVSKLVSLKPITDPEP